MPSGRSTVCDLDGTPAAIFLSFDQGRGEAFLNGLRTDPDIRRMGVATAIIQGMDADLKRKGVCAIRMATTSLNTPMITLCKSKLNLEPVQFRMCQCNARNDGPMRATLVGDNADVDALYSFCAQSDYFKHSHGMCQDGPGQFRAFTKAELAARIAIGNVYVLAGATRPDLPSPIAALAVVGKSPMGPNPLVAFIAGDAVGEMMDALRCLIPADHPSGPSAAEVFGYLPVGCAAYEMAAQKTALPSGAEWYCPRETLQLVMEWRAGSLSSFWA